MNQIARIAAAPAVTFSAWSVGSVADGNRHHEALPRALPEWVETADEAAQVVCEAGLSRSIMVLRSDASERPTRRHVLHVYTVRRRAVRKYVRGPHGAVREPAEYPELQMMVCVGEGFAPVEPWRFDGDAVGADQTLVEIEQ